MLRRKKKEISTAKPLISKVDKSLDSLLDKGLFQDKVDRANEVLATVGLPKNIR
jgi:hypothetical protein